MFLPKGADRKNLLLLMQFPPGSGLSVYLTTPWLQHYIYSANMMVVSVCRRKHLCNTALREANRLGVAPRAAWIISDSCQPGTNCHLLRFFFFRKKKKRHPSVSWPLCLLPYINSASAHVQHIPSFFLHYTAQPCATYATLSLWPDTCSVASACLCVC